MKNKNVYDEFGFILTETQELNRVDAHPLDLTYVNNLISKMKECGYNLKIVNDRNTYQQYILAVSE